MFNAEDGALKNERFITGKLSLLQCDIISDICLIINQTEDAFSGLCKIKKVASALSFFYYCRLKGLSNMPYLDPARLVCYVFRRIKHYF